MKKILFFNLVLFAGGVEKVMKDIVENLPEDEFEVTIFTFFKEEIFEEIYSSKIRYMYEFDCDVTTINEIGFSGVYEIIDLREKEILDKLNKENFDIVVAMKEGVSVKFVSKLNCENKICWIHINYKEQKYTQKIFNKKEELKCMRKFKKAVCVSKATRDIFIEEIGDSGNLCVKYNPIDNNQILEKSKEKIDFDFPKDMLNFITVGRLSEQKGYDRLIEATNKLLDKGFKFKLYIIGDGVTSYKRSLMNKVRYRENIKFLGNIQNPYPYLKKADCFVCSSNWEAYGVAIQEAIILHLPIIMTNYRGAEEAFENGTAGIIVDNSEQGIYDGMLEILNNKEKLEEYKKYLEQDKYVTVEQRMKDILEVFEE